jgi:Tol biopolymer transport system component
LYFHEANQAICRIFIWVKSLEKYFLSFGLWSGWPEFSPIGRLLTFVENIKK